MAYVDRVLGHYRRVREILRDDLEGMALVPESRMAIYGAGEMGELMYLVLRDMGVTRVDFFDEHGGRMVAFSSDRAERSDDLRANGVTESQIITFLKVPEIVEGA